MSKPFDLHKELTRLKDRGWTVEIRMPRPQPPAKREPKPKKDK